MQLPRKQYNFSVQTAHYSEILRQQKQQAMCTEEAPSTYAAAGVHKYELLFVARNS